MAHESYIDHIDYQGVSYEFQDSTARRLINDVSRRVEQKDDRYQELIDAEEERAKNAERALEDSKVSKDGNKVLSTNDFTNEYKELVLAVRDMEGATESRDGQKGVVPAPTTEDIGKFLCGDGTWADPIGTTYDVATEVSNGLMSAVDKAKLNAMDIVNDDVLAGSITKDENSQGETRLREVLSNGKVKTTTFKNDGSILQEISNTDGSKINLLTRFDVDGKLVERTRV